MTETTVRLKPIRSGPLKRILSGIGIGTALNFAPYSSQHQYGQDPKLNLRNLSQRRIGFMAKERQEALIREKGERNRIVKRSLLWGLVAGTALAIAGVIVDYNLFKPRRDVENYDRKLEWTVTTERGYNDIIRAYQAQDKDAKDLDTRILVGETAKALGNPKSDNLHPGDKVRLPDYGKPGINP